MLYPVKIEFKDYPSGNWQDWSEYLSEPPRISKKVESENEGEAGLIVFDDAEVSFRYESGNPVYSAFSIDLTSKQRYLFRISTFKTDLTFVQLFEGVADFSTLKWNEFNNIISFSIIDKLSALNLLKKTTLRGASKNLLYDRNPDPTVNNIAINTGAADTPTHHKWFNMYYKQDTLIKPTTNANTPQLGEIIQSPFDGNALSVVKFKAKKVGENLDTDPMYLDVLTTDTTYPKTSGNQKTVSNLFYYINEIYGVDLLVKQYRTDYKVYYKDAGNTIEIALQPGYEVIGYDALKLIDALIKSVWPEITIIKRPVNLEFILPLDNFIRLVTEDLFGKEPLDALKMIADSMKCYIFIDRDGNLVIQSKSSLDTSGQTRSIGNTKIISGPDKKYSWDKLADGANIRALSWVKDDVTGEFLIGVAEITKQEVGFSSSGKIKPKNAIKKDIIVGDPNINTQEELNTYAAQEALSILDFYGKRHSSFDLTLNLDDNTIDWELIDKLTLNSLTTFFTKLELDLAERTVKIEAVEEAGHDYDFRQLVFGSAESSEASINPSSGYGGGSYYYGFSPIFNLPLQMSGGIVSLLTTDNLKLTSDQLDTAQPIKTTDTPTFNQMLLSAAATLSNHAVRADRTLQITTNAPLTGGGIAVDLTADRNWTLGINSASLLGTTNQINVANGSGVILGLTNVTLSLPQNIHTAATPTFNQLTLSSAGSGSSNAVRADRTLQITTNAPLTGGGVAVDLTANRSWALGINSANLLGTTNRITVTNGTGVILGTSNVTLNLPQDIHTGASPTFAGLTINGNILQSTNAYIKNNFTSGWTGSGWQLDYSVSLAGKSNLEIDSLTVRGSMKVYELIINQIRATNGSLFVSSSAVVKSTEPGNIGQIKIHFETPNNLNISPFAPGDTIMVQRVDINGTTILRKIVLYVEVATGDYVDATYIYQFSGQTPQAGDVFVRLGNDGTTANRQGNIYLTSDDSASPYIDIYDGVTDYSNWATPAVRKVRLGKLTGLSDSNFGSLSGYGLYATNAYLKGGIWASFGNIAGWTIDAQKLSKSTYIVLDAYNEKISVNNDAVKMYYASPTDYGIKDSAGKFALGYTNQIAGWEFDTSSLTKTFNDGTYDYALELRNGTHKGLYLYIDYGAVDTPQMLSFGSYRTYSGGATSGYGIRYDVGSTTLFQLGTTGNKISAFSFDTSKITSGSATIGISINTSATPFITGTSAKGFEIYDVNDPKLFIGKKDGSYLDYNIVANTLRLKGGTISASSFSTVAGTYTTESGLVIGVEQGAGLGANVINFNSYVDATHYGYEYLYGTKEADTGTYPTDLTYNGIVSLGSYKYGNYSYHGTTLEIRGNGGIPIIQLRTFVPNSTTQQGGLYIKQDAVGGSPVKVVGARRTGWAAATGTATRTTFATSTVTTSQLAERVKALIDDLIAHGLIGA